MAQVISFIAVDPVHAAHGQKMKTATPTIKPDQVIMAWIRVCVKRIKRGSITKEAKENDGCAVKDQQRNDMGSTIHSCLMYRIPFGCTPKITAANG